METEQDAPPQPPPASPLLLAELPLKVDGKEVYRFMTTLYLHQNQLSWSRLQTQFAVEAGILAGFFSQETAPYLSAVGMCLGTIVIWLLYQLVLRDWEVRDQNNEKLEAFHTPLKVETRIPASRKWLHGRHIARYISYGSILTNLTLAVMRLNSLL